jgi:hypothetical protein
MTPTPSPAADALPPLPLDVAVGLHDQLLTVDHDLDRLDTLLGDACAALLQGFHGAIGHCDALRGRIPGEPGLALLRAQLLRTVTALQFGDLSTQLIGHTRRRLRAAADALARDALTDDADAVVTEPPPRPNPVTQDEMDGGTVELF